MNLFVRSDSDDVPLTEKGAPAVESVVVDVANFGAYIAEKHGNNNRGFRDQFLVSEARLQVDPLRHRSHKPAILIIRHYIMASLSLQCLDPKEAGREWMIASLPDNRLRNRFKNITPCMLLGVSCPVGTVIPVVATHWCLLHSDALRQITLA